MRTTSVALGDYFERFIKAKIAQGLSLIHILDLLHKRFIVFELDNISENRTLLPVVTIIIMETFLAKMRDVYKRQAVGRSTLFPADRAFAADAALDALAAEILSLME